MTAQELEAKSTEDAILKAAEEVFIEKGFAGARVQKIADRAGITQPLLHYYFRSKENIYRKVLTRVTGDFFSHIESALSDRTTFEEVLRDFISSAMDYLVKNPHAPSFILHEIAQGGPIAGEVLAGTLLGPGLSFPQRMAALIEREHSEGRIRSADPVQFILTLVGSCLWFFLAEPIVRAVMGTLLPDSSFDPSHFVEARKKAIFDVLYYGMKTRDS